MLKIFSLFIVLILPVIFANYDPPVADANDPNEAEEGTAIEFDASASTDIDKTGLEFRRDFDDDGAWYTPWSSVSTSTNTWYDDCSGNARLQVSGIMSSDDTTAPVMILNVAPDITPFPDQAINSGENVTLEVYFTDPGTLDSHTAIIDWGDGNSEPGIVNETDGSGNVIGNHQYLIPGSYTVNVTVRDDNEGKQFITFNVDVEAVITIIDIKPFSYTNPIKLGNNGRTPVAILTTEEFDAATVNASTLNFGPGKVVPLYYALEYVDGDDDIDMILHFGTQELGLAYTDTAAILTGQTNDGIYFEGTDSVSIMPATDNKSDKDKNNGNNNVSGQNDDSGSPANGGSGGKSDAPGQNKDPGSPANGGGRGKSDAPGQNKDSDPPANGGGGGNSDAPGQNKDSDTPAKGKGKNK